MAEVLLHTGEAISFAELHREPVALIFLRHLGCLFCREHVADLRGYPELNIAFVAMAPPEEAAAFRETMASPHRFICDPDRKLHAQFGIASAKFSQVINPRVLLKTAKALRYGVAKPTGDPLSLGAVIVLDRDGKERWTHHAKDVADNATPREIAEALKTAGGG